MNNANKSKEETLFGEKKKKIVDNFCIGLETTFSIRN